MSGHSKWANIKHRKGRQDAKRGKLFGKLAKAIEVAARNGGGNTEFNPTLATAVDKAKAASMPNDNVDRAIKRGTGEVEGAIYEETFYDGYGPGGVALYVQVLTDNRNRTASEIRVAFTKFGGNLGETGSVSFMFNRVGQIVYGAATSAEDMFDAALEAGASDVDSSDAGHEITCEPDDFSVVRDALEEKFGAAEDARLDWKPQTSVAVDEAAADTLLKLIDALEDNDDVQRVAANFDVDDDVLERLSA